MKRLGSLGTAGFTLVLELANEVLFGLFFVEILLTTWRPLIFKNNWNTFSCIFSRNTIERRPYVLDNELESLLQDLLLKNH